MKKLTLVTLSAICFYGCSKDDNNTTSPSGGYTEGTIRFTNNSTNPYNVSIDGVAKGSVNGNTHVELKATKGFHTLKAEQASGYLVYPTVVKC